MILFKNEKPLKDLDSVSLAEMLRAHFVEHYPAGIVQRLTDAIQVASYLHRHDVRRGGRGRLPNPPYIEHPLRVAIRLIRFGVENPDAIIAAILHDTVEDHPFEFSEFQGVGKARTEGSARNLALQFIGKHFGYHVANVVSDVTNPILRDGMSKADKIKAYQDHVAWVVTASGHALIVKVSDFKDNAGSLHHHYEYGDPKVTYFLDRYEPLLEIYRNALKSGRYGFDAEAALTALDEVEEQFRLFREAA